MPLNPIDELKLALAQVGVSQELLSHVGTFLDDLQTLIRVSADAASAQEIASLVQAAESLRTMEHETPLAEELLNRVRALIAFEGEEDPAVELPPPVTPASA